MGGELYGGQDPIALGEPDLSGKTVVSFSELETGRRCPHRHDLAYRQRWQSPTASRPLQIGKLWHSTLEAHYRALQADGSLKDARMAARMVFRQAETEGVEPQRLPPDIAQTVEFMYSRYVERWADEDRRKWKILAVEHEALTPLPPHPDHPELRFVLKCKIDLVAKTREPKPKLMIWDHKSHRDLPDDSELALHDQFALYEAALRLLGREVFGCLYNTTRYFIPKSGIWEDLDLYIQRRPLYRTQDELDTIVREAVDDLAVLYGYPPERAPRHPDPKTCNWCQFKIPCIEGRKRGSAHERDMMLARGFRQDFGRH